MEAAKRFLEKENKIEIDSLPPIFIEPLVSHGLKLELVEPGRLLCSFIVPNRLLNAGNFMHGGATAALVDVIGSGVMLTSGVSMTGVSVEINVSYLDAAYVGEEIEVEAKTLRMGKAIGVVSVEFRKKKSGKIVAQGRHTKYFAKRYLEKKENEFDIETVPRRLFEVLVSQGYHLHLIEPGRIICSLTVPTRLLKGDNSLHGGATATMVDLIGSAVLYTHGVPASGVSVEINISYLDSAYAGEEIEVEAKTLLLGKAIGVVSVELRKKNTGKIIAHGRHSKYLVGSSKM
ncbi:hypothetical protein G4B88_029038 [Cannabis sativa]|uniref:Acyl-coenzyme A thioesterase 13 n=1 Tax=Cannabis sativa TaxID=3483 RepID=A0A7J6DU29_CANSA|nr:hypothetical protein G4B88_029038 [Cannabis sativa]